MEFFPWKSMSRARIDQTLSQTMWQKSRNFKHLHLYFSFVLFICVFCLCFAFVFAFFSHWHFWLCVWIISFCICAFYLCFDARFTFTFVLVLSTHAPKMPGPMYECCLFWCVWITQTLSQTTRNFKYLHLCFSFVFFICALHLRLPFFFSHLHFWFCAYIKSFCICVFYLCFDTRVAFTFVLVLSTHAPKIPGPVNVRTLAILPSNDVKIYMFPSHVCELCVWVLVCFLWKPMPRVWISQTLSQAMWQSPKF